MSALSLLVATPAYNNQVCAAYTHSLLGLAFSCVQRGIGFDFAHTTSQSLIPVARNDLVHHFLSASQCSHLLFIDGDMTFEAAQVLRMLDANLAVIAAICPQKSINWANIKQAVLHNPAIAATELAALGASYKTFAAHTGDAMRLDTPFPVAQIGTGIMLIRREVFATLLQHVKRDAQGKAIFFEAAVNSAGEFLSEDLYFCERLHAAGIPLYAAPWLNIGHIGNYTHQGSLAALSAHGLSL